MILRRGVSCTNSLATSLVVIEPTFTPPRPRGRYYYGGSGGRGSGYYNGGGYGTGSGYYPSYYEQDTGLTLGSMCVVTSLAMAGDVLVAILTQCV